MAGDVGPGEGLPADLPILEPGGEGERRQVTVLFTDLVGYTSFAERAGEEAAYALMQRLSALMTAAVHEQRGTVRSFTGDGIMALFGVPVALEDAPLRACRAALSIQQRMATAAKELEGRHGLRPWLRIGINAGPAIVGRMGEGASATALGDTVNLASRLQTLAEPGGILISDAVQKLVQGLVESEPAGDYEIKGKAERQKVYRLAGIREGAARFDAALSRGLTAYVGRGPESEVLARSLEAASLEYAGARCSRRPRDREVSAAARVPQQVGRQAGVRRVRQLLAGWPAHAVPALHRDCA
jgi:class 3 adenylate cyclase